MPHPDPTPTARDERDAAETRQEMLLRYHDEYYEALNTIYNMAEDVDECPVCHGRIEGSPETDYDMEHEENCPIGIAVDVLTGRRRQYLALRAEREAVAAYANLITAAKSVLTDVDAVAGDLALVELQIALAALDARAGERE